MSVINEHSNGNVDFFNRTEFVWMRFWNRFHWIKNSFWTNATGNLQRRNFGIFRSNGIFTRVRSWTVESSKQGCSSSSAGLPSTSFWFLPKIVTSEKVTNRQTSTRSLFDNLNQVTAFDMTVIGYWFSRSKHKKQLLSTSNIYNLSQLIHSIWNNVLWNWCHCF